MNDLPEELIEKLKIIEKETVFFSQKPLKPRKLNVFTLTCDALFAIGIVMLFVLDASSPLPYLFSMIFINGIVNHLHLKELHNNYTTACEIINFYKTNESPKT